MSQSNQVKATVVHRPIASSIRPLYGLAQFAGVYVRQLSVGAMVALLVGFGLFVRIQVRQLEVDVSRLGAAHTQAATLHERLLLEEEARYHLAASEFYREQLGLVAAPIVAVELGK